jgi:hypothetical protein
MTVPEQYRSKTPGRLRDLAHKQALNVRPVVQQALLDAAGEIEGGEEAYAALVDKIRALYERLAVTERNLRDALKLIPCGSTKRTGVRNQ